MTLDSAELEREIGRREALLSGHFLLSSGLHSDGYVQCAKMLQDTHFAQRLGELIAGACRAKPEIVVSPAMGGIIIGHEVGKAFRVPFIFTERADGQMVLRRGFAVERGQKVLIVEDVLTTGKSSREVMDVVRGLGGEVVGVASIINRGVDAAAMGVPVASLVKVELKTYKPDECPLCKKGLPVIKPGSRPQPK